MNGPSMQLNPNAILPELTMVVAAVIVMLVDIVNRGGRSVTRPLLPWVALVGVAVTAGVSIWLMGEPASTFQNMLTTDDRAMALNLVTLTGAALAILLSIRYIPTVNSQTGEYYTLILLITAGMMVMGAALDLMVVFLALEIFSMGLYILAGLKRSDLRSNEAAMKYFLLGAFASAFFIYGAGFVYGATGSTQFDAIAASLASGAADMNLLYVGIAMLIAGFGFKVSLAPFHMWTPDVYQGAPTPVAAFMSIGTKAGAFAAFYRFFVVGVGEAQPVWGWALAILAVLTMTLGQPGCAAPEQPQTSARLLQHRSRRLHSRRSGDGDACGHRRRALLLDQLRVHEHGRLRRRNSARTTRRNGRAGQPPQRALQASSTTGVDHEYLHVQPGWCAALCRLLRQILRLCRGR
jgi:NADH-quinone oxidoreductase subunit N